jgi:disulfide bond formation protein DsbB
MKMKKWMSYSLLWVLLIALGLTLEAIALYYQYELQALPCTLCIKFRVFVVLLMFVALIGLWFKQYKTGLWVASISLLLVTLGMLEVSYQLLGTERGFILSECSVASIFPTWFALDQWLPWLFEIQTTCGYTPIIGFSITMAEVLMMLSIGLTLLALLMIFALIKKPHSIDG